MDRANINKKLKRVISEAEALGIPVSKRIDEHVYINPRPRRRFGCCKTVGRNYVIEISEFILQGDDKAIDGVIAHEVLHTCKGAFKHGEVWKKYADLMNKSYGYNIKRTSSFEEMGIPEPLKEPNIKYIIKCKECGAEYPREKFTSVMKKLNSYRCKCGGKLEIYRLDK